MTPAFPQGATLRRNRTSGAAASYTPGSPRRLSPTELAAPALLPPSDAPSLAASSGCTHPSAWHRLLPPARRYGRCQRGAARRVRCCPFATLVPREPAPDRPSCLPAAARSLASRRPAPVRARRGRDRQRVPAASSRRSRRGVLSVGAALLSPADPSRSTSLR